MTTAQKFDYAAAVKPNGIAVLHGMPETNICLSHNLYDLIQPVAENGWPEKIIFTAVLASYEEGDPRTVTETGRMGITWFLLGQAFLAFFENISDLIHSHEGKEWKVWKHETLKFGYQVRNSVAHSGCIHFKKPTCPSVTWRGLTFSPLDNGRPIFDKVGVVELILLMFDIESIVKKWN